MYVYILCLRLKKPKDLHSGLRKLSDKIMNYKPFIKLDITKFVCGI